MRDLHLRLILLLLLLWAVPAIAQDQELAPDGELASDSDMDDDDRANQCDSVSCYLQVDEDPDGAGDGLEPVPNVDDGDIVFTFPTPSSDPSTTASAQAFHIMVSRCRAGSGLEASGGTNPDYDLEVWCNGSQDAVIVNDTAIAALDVSTVHNWTFSTSGCASDGSDVEVLFRGGLAGAGGSGRIGCIESIEWEVTHVSAGGGEEMMVIVAE